MRVELAPSLILHRRAYRDTSLMLEIFSREHGRIGLIARGARRPKGRWRGLLEPLCALRLSWSGRGEMQTLTAVEPDSRSATPSGDHLYAAFYAAELVLRLTARHDPHPALFDHLRTVIASLAQEQAIAPALRGFERDLLAELGYGLLLDVETESARPVEPALDYYYHPEHGLRVSDSRAQAAEVAISGAALLALASDALHDAAHQRQARQLLTAALAPHLGGKPLRSAQTLRALKRLKSTGAESA